MNQTLSGIVFCENQINRFFHNQKIGRLLKRSNISNQKGISPVSGFTPLFALVFTGKNLFRAMEMADGKCAMVYDNVYRFLNSVHTNWRRSLFC